MPLARVRDRLELEVGERSSGGVVELVARLGKGRVCVTVGSALDIFGGKLPYAEVVAWSQEVSKGGGGGGAEPGAA